MTWKPAGLSGLCVKALATSAAAPGAVWAATKPPRLFQSEDGGGTWDEVLGFARMRRRWWVQPAEKPHTGYVSTLAVSPADPDVMVAGIEAFKLLRSADGGRTSARLGRGVAFDAHRWPSSPSIRNACSSRPAWGFGSADAGATWTKTNGGLDRRYGFCLAPDPTDPDSAYLGAAPMRSAHTNNARACVYRFARGTWEKVQGGLPLEFDRLPYAIATSLHEPECVYVGIGDGTIWRSEDRGVSWNALAARLSGVRRLVLAS